MNTNLKTNLINSIQYELADILSADDLKAVTNIITLKLNDYEVHKACTDVVVRENESETIVKMFLTTKKIEGKSDKTIEAYGRRLADLLRVTNKPIKEISVYDLRMYLAHKQMGGCSERTISGYRAVLVSFFNWAYGDGLLKDNPVLNLGVIKYNREIKKPFSSVELELLRNACDNLRSRTILETLLATGCRVSELTNIKITDIDFAEKNIKVLGKGNKERIVYFDAVTEMWLRKYIESRSDELNALFLGKGNKTLLAGGVRTMLKRLEAVSGVKNVHPHRFRRTLATTLIKRDMSIQDVARILGHADINTTMTYVYMDDTNVKAAYQKRAA